MRTLAAGVGIAVVVGGLGVLKHERLSAQQPSHDHGAMTMPDMAGAGGATQSMSSEHLHMSGHMKMTASRPATPEDVQRASAIVSTLRTTLAKYRDHHVAISDGYRPFLPNLPQPQYHFTNYGRGFAAALRFDPAKPTSLLYRKSADGYELLGAMYTAPKDMSEDRLNARVPLSVAQWHAHVNICLPPRSERHIVDWTKFGFAGSITTPGACNEAGGRFEPQIFGWMLHVYPFEQTQNQIWRH